MPRPVGKQGVHTARMVAVRRQDVSIGTVAATADGVGGQDGIEAGNSEPATAIVNSPPAAGAPCDRVTWSFEQEARGGIRRYAVIAAITTLVSPVAVDGLAVRLLGHDAFAHGDGVACAITDVSYTFVVVDAENPSRVGYPGANRPRQFIAGAENVVRIARPVAGRSWSIVRPSTGLLKMLLSGLFGRNMY